MEPAVLLQAVIYLFDAEVPPPAGVNRYWLGGGLPATAGPNEVVLERVTLVAGAAIPPPLLYTVATGNPEPTADGGLLNTGSTTVELVTLRYEPIPIPEEGAISEETSVGTPAATPQP